MEENQRQLEVLPSTGETLDVVGRLFGQVSRPDDEKLRKGQIGPQHDESQCQFSKIVKVRRRDRFRHGLRLDR